MALYLGSSEINPVIATIKEVPTEQDLTLMGNELRRAYAYTNVENVSGQYNIFSPNYTAIMEQPFEITGPCYASTTHVIINGVVYSVSSSNNKLILTQVTNSGTWKKIGGLYSKYLVSTNNTIWTCSSNPSAINMNNITLHDPEILDNYIIDNGILYKVSNGLKMFDNSGNWSYVGTGGGIRNNKIVKFTINSSKTGFSEVVDCFDTEFSPLLIGTYETKFYGYKNNKFYFAEPSSNKYNSVVNTTGHTPIAIFHSVWDSTGCICEDNNFYTFNINESSNAVSLSLKFSNITSWFKTGNGSGIFRNGSQIYAYTHATQTNPINDTFSNISFLPDYSSCLVSMGSTMGNNVFLKYGNSYITRTTKYKSRYTTTKAYESLTNSIPNQDITYGSDSSIIINNKTYNRDANNDGIFTFVPNELANHTFTDQEICQAYLNAGIIQQNG